MNAERRGMLLGWSQIGCFFSLDVEMVHSLFLSKYVLYLLICLISHGFRKVLYIQAYHEIYCSSEEQRLDSILPPVIT